MPVLVAACLIAALIEDWWPLELAALMVGVGARRSTLAYHRLLPYQPGWLAVPLGAARARPARRARARRAESRRRSGRRSRSSRAPGCSGQVLGHAVLPLARLSYAEDGGELGRAGAGARGRGGGPARGRGRLRVELRQPVVHLSAGVHVGPLVLDRRQKLVGDAGAVVRGGIVVRADDVTVENVTVIGGDYGIDVEDAKDVVLEDVTVLGAKLDGIHVRRSGSTIRDCRILSPPAPYTQGIDISFAFDLTMSMVEGCTIDGGAEGIVTHSSNTTLMGNRVSRTTLRAIDDDRDVDGDDRGQPRDRHARGRRSSAATTPSA